VREKKERNHQGIKKPGNNGIEYETNTRISKTATTTGMGKCR
jgi:hypothetical protein